MLNKYNRKGESRLQNEITSKYPHKKPTILNLTRSVITFSSINYSSHYAIS